MVLRLSRQQREEMLAQPWVGVLTVAAEDGRAPLTAPIWYDYEPGGVLTILTSPESRKVRLIADAGRFALCAQKIEPPYQYVTVEGPVVESRPTVKDDRLVMARRYLPPDLVVAYVEMTHEAQSDNVAISMRPERWSTADFSDIGERLVLSNSGKAASSPPATGPGSS